MKSPPGTDFRKEILHVLRQAKAVGTSHVYELVPRLNQNTVRRYLSVLVKEGYLSRPFFGAYARTSKQYIPKEKQPSGGGLAITPFSASTSVDCSTARERKGSTMHSRLRQTSITDPHFLSIISRTGSQRSALT